eukprot:TRINITY_DN10828_c0_g3_i1.p1 TRINITY_DN10828_c0_g3~~TRINITY_DN10828_c0_g3_i1.p1  ORF type:complete len:1597 (-),score=337.82 TRINITY_DN10828_c0_g3_i1:34-4824(-)
MLRLFLLLLLRQLLACGGSAGDVAATSAAASLAAAPSSRTRLRVPNFLTCEGAPFHPAWRTFRLAAAENARRGYPVDLELQKAGALLIHHFEPLLLDGARAFVVSLRSAATGDIYEYRPPAAVSSLFSSSVGSGAAETKDEGAAALVALEAAAAAAGNHSAAALAAAVSIRDIGSSALSFCLYGYVHALFLELRHSGSASPERRGAKGSAEDDSECAQRRGLLQVAEQLLGSETQETNFLESSGWPVGALDIHLALYAARQDGGKDGCHALYDRSLLPPYPSSSSSSGASSPLFFGAALLAGPTSSRALLSKVPGRRRSEALRLAAFGLHVSSTLEPVSALREAAEEAGSKVSVSYFGHPCYGNPGDRTLRHACLFKCQMLGEPCDDDQVAHVLRGMFNASGLYEELPWSIDEALQAIAAARAQNQALREPDLMVCSGPLVLCYLFDVLAPELPLVLPVCSQLLWGAPLDGSSRAMLLGHVRLMARQPNRWVVGCNDFVVAQCLYQTGVRLPLVPRVALYLPKEARWSASNESTGRWREVLVLRSRYWHRLPGQYFMDVLESFLRSNEARYNMTFSMAASMGPDELPPQEISRFRAVMLIPNDLTVFAFVEAYAMNVPTFVPTPEWLYRLRRTVPFGFLQVSASLGPEVVGSDVRRTFPFPPFLPADRSHPDDLLTFVYWQSTSELHSYPAVQQFGSIPELLERLLLVDLHAVSEAMAAFSAKQRREAVGEWRAALSLFDLVEPAEKLASEGSANSELPRRTAADAAGNKVGAAAALRRELSCEPGDGGGFSPAWTLFLRKLRENAAAGFLPDASLVEIARQLWQNVLDSIADVDGGSLTHAAALFHQSLTGQADGTLLAAANHCHYGLVSVLFVLARHCLPDATISRGLWRYSLHQSPADPNGDQPAGSRGALAGEWQGCESDLVGLALNLLGDGSALDFLEDSDWPISALDVAAVAETLRGDFLDSRGFGLERFRRDGASIAAAVLARTPWCARGGCGGAHAPVSPAILPSRSEDIADQKWRLAIVGAHPSLSADVAEAIQHALDNRTQHRFFGLSCPQHHAASHHCKFRCEVLGQCEDDAVFSSIMGKMLDWGAFEPKPYEFESVAAELGEIARAAADLREAELIVCTGPFVLCAMLRDIVPVPMLVYLGLALTYLATASFVGKLLSSARSAANLADFHRFDPLQGGSSLALEGDAPSAVVATDLIRVAQFHHAVGVWTSAVPPLFLYQCGSSDLRQLGGCDEPRLGGSSSPEARRAVALRPELWRRAMFGASFRGVLRRLNPPAVDFQDRYYSYAEIAAYDAAVLVPWDNDVMTFYELYHAGMPMLVPSESLMAKWLPAVRWGSLEADDLNLQRLPGLASARSVEDGRYTPLGAVPWMDQRTLSASLAGGSSGWIRLSDYYRWPHVLRFASASDLVAQLVSADLAAVGEQMRRSSERLRADGLQFYRALASRLLLGGSVSALDVLALRGSPALEDSGELGTLAQGDDVPGRDEREWEEVPGGGTCAHGFLRQADFPAETPGDAPADATTIAGHARGAGAQSCRAFCSSTPACAVAVFNGLCCMVYDLQCDVSALRQDGGRGEYNAWRRKVIP